MQRSLILCAKSAASRNFLHLPLPVPEHCDLRSYRGAIAVRADKLKFNPLILWRNRVFVNQQRATLVGDHDVENAAIPQIGHGYRAPVIGVGYAHGLSDIRKFASAIIYPHALLLIA